LALKLLFRATEPKRVETGWQKKNDFGMKTVASGECIHASTDGFGIRQSEI
jgi:hypothetical protein